MWYNESAGEVVQFLSLGLEGVYEYESLSFGRVGLSGPERGNALSGSYDFVLVQKTLPGRYRVRPSRGALVVPHKLGGRIIFGSRSKSVPCVGQVVTSL